MADPGIVRNRLKIEAAVANARAFLQVQEEFGSFDAYIWRFVGGAPMQNAGGRWPSCPRETPESEAMSKDLVAARLPLRRPDHLLRLHAGGRHGERPCRGVLPVCGAGGGAGE